MVPPRSELASRFWMLPSAVLPLVDQGDHLVRRASASNSVELAPAKPGHVAGVFDGGDLHP